MSMFSLFLVLYVKEGTVYIILGIVFQGSFHSPYCGGGWNIISIYENKVFERIFIIMGRTVNFEKMPGDE